MPAKVTLAELRQRVRWAADCEFGQAGSALEDDELDNYINLGLQYLHNILVQAHGDEYFQETGTFPTVANTSVYDLEADFFEMVNVVLNDGTSSRTVPRMEPGEVGAGFELVMRGYGQDIRHMHYVIRPGGTNDIRIEFIPTPLSAWTCWYRYIPAMPKLVSPSDEMDGINGWEELAVLRAAYKIMSKVEDDTTAVEKDMAALEQQIQELADRRDAGDTPGTVDVYGQAYLLDEEYLDGDIIP